jgi:hypothetical protein
LIVLTGKLPQDHFFSVNYSFCILATFCFYKIWKLCFFITYINNKKKALTQTQYCLNVSPPIYPVHWYHLTNTDINLFGFLSHCFPPDVKNIKYYIDWIDNTKLLLAGKSQVLYSIIITGVKLMTVTVITVIPRRGIG